MNSKELRHFGLVVAVMIVLIFGFILPFLLSFPRPNWPYYLAVSLTIWSIVIPRTLFLLYVPWMSIASVLAKINGTIILGVIFYVLITPYSLILRALGKQPIKRSPCEVNGSYWKESAKPDDSHMETPY